MSPKGPYEDIWTPPPSLAPSTYLTISASKSFLFLSRQNFSLAKRNTHTYIERTEERAMEAGKCE